MQNDLVIDCPTGLSGDMLLSAFLDLDLPEDFLPKQIKLLGIEKFLELNIYEDKSYGLRGLKHSIKFIQQKEFDRSWRGIKQLITDSSLSISIKQKVLEVFQVLAKAESCVHGSNLDEVHFHEIGSIEAVINIVGVCAIIDYLQPGKIYCMTPPTGVGNVKTSHGVLPVPVPSVLEIARRKNIPLLSGDWVTDVELTTPTGIALISVFAEEYKQPMCFQPLSIGVGLGTKDIDRPNILRVFEIKKSQSHNGCESLPGLAWQELICQETWVDDSTPEDLADLINQLRIAGAIDVVSNPVQMKKGRQGLYVKAIVSLQKAAELRSIWFSKGTTLGLREHSFGRWVLPRRNGWCMTSLGKIKVKQVKRPDGSTTVKPEHDDLIKLSKNVDFSLEEIKKKIFSELNNVTPEEDWRY